MSEPRDHLLYLAAEMLRSAALDEGPRPDYHREVMARHRREWPTLWRAIDAVLRESGDQDHSVERPRETEGRGTKSRSGVEENKHA